MSAQMTSLKAQYGVSTQRALVQAIADEFARETGERRSVRTAEAMLDGMLEAEYQKLESVGAARKHDRQMAALDDAAKTLDEFGEPEFQPDNDAAYERWLEDRGDE